MRNFGLLIVVVSTLSEIAQAGLKPLSQVRHQLTLPAQSPEERQIVADQAFHLINSMYVHRDLKIHDFGAAIDPVPRLLAHRTMARSLGVSESHQTLSSIFLDLHDNHTNYMLPSPLTCHVALFPLGFTGVQVQGQEAVAVEIIKMDLKKYPGGPQVMVGDLVLEINGVPTEGVVQSLVALGAGANKDAMRSRAIELLSMRPIAQAFIPATDTLKVKLAHADGTTSEIELPWVVHSSETCLTKGGERVARHPRFDRYQGAFTSSTDLFQQQYAFYNRPFDNGEDDGTDPFAVDAAASADKEIYEATVLATPIGRLGYLKLLSFDSKDMSNGQLIQAIRHHLEHDFNDAVGLVIDVRDNPGGDVTFAERLVQLFTPLNVETSKATMLANALNVAVFQDANDGHENRWSETLKSSMANGQRYIQPLSLTSMSEANELGQVWFKPTVLLTNANCYSACDVFAAEMQDHGASMVIGEHASTGAGGANVIPHDVFVKVLEKHTGSPFRSLPQGQEMRVSWRQCIRVGRNKGQLIENRGVLSDKVFPRTLDDLTGGPRGIMNQVRDVIAQSAPNYQAAIDNVKRPVVVLENGTPARWVESVRGIDRLDVRIKDKVVQSLAVPLTATNRDLTIDLAGYSSSWHLERVELIGYRGSQRSFRVVRPLRWVGQYQPLANGEQVTADPATGAQGLIRDEEHQNPQGGWTMQGGLLRVGSSSKYPNNVRALAYLPLALHGVKTLKAKFALNLTSEYLSDFFRVYIVNVDSGLRYEVLNISGKVDHTFSDPLEIPVQGNGRFDLVFEFESDENWQMAGPILSAITVDAE